MSCEVWIDETAALLRVAVVAQNKLIGYYQDILCQPLYTGAVYVGKVRKLQTALAFAEIELTEGLTGFLPLKRTVPKVGELIVVEVTAPPREDKVLSVKRLNRPVVGKNVRQVSEGLDALERAVKDFSPITGRSNCFSILARGERLGLTFSHYADKIPLFELIDLESQIAGLFARVVPLSCGGSLIFETTAVGHMIDVNSGESTLSLPALNRAALQEVARQMRLRNLGGIILIDLVGDARHVGSGLKEYLQSLTQDDPHQVDVYGLTALGLMECTRARYGAALSASH